jgi:multiple sugar transport system substrate-binding protein
MAGIVLNGITWGHSRGITPLLALSQRYAELHSDIEVRWKKRSLQEFADYPIEKLTYDFDLLIIDHPWVGCAAKSKCVLPLEKELSPTYLQDQADNSVGASHFSYQYQGSQWALAVDAAAPSASYRQDLFEKNNVSVPQTWFDVIDLAKEGKVAVPAIPIDILMNFYTFCIAQGTEPFQNKTEIIDEATGTAAIETMKELYSRIDKEMFACNPIAVAEYMSSTDDYWYCPFSYAYSNYSRKGYAAHLLQYTHPVSFNEKQLKTTIGGTGLAVSAFSKNREAAIDFAAMVASGECQRTMYVQHGGQPAHQSAWTDEEANRLTNNFFKKLLPVMQNGYLRPRYNGYLHFQDLAGIPLHQCLLQNGNPRAALTDMNTIYRQSRISEQSITLV